MKTICYCFNHTEDEIIADVIEHQGHSTILEKITAAKKQRVCQCEIKHPEKR